ncbi:polyamine transporter 2 [Purpureocillium lavendulum]|uniref:Polyamine transporter 2 n=1 Tax=Purpureocillium lavendulum TaxID=1247861 RepID=A0AB34FWG7_9HYPO|nr:polyamine transporter 2 [Purpureocillium lavendulum]
MSGPGHSAPLHHRMPTVFGPAPGPRQTVEGRTRDGSKTSNKEAFITFTAPQASLSSLLPPGFLFQKPGPSGYFTIAAKRLDNLDWLGGRGYSLLSVYIHGIQYTAPEDGKVHRGTYIPVLWESMADPIISGREELGYPKLFANLDITDPAEDAYAMTASWEGSQFAKFTLTGLREVRQGSTQPAKLAPAAAGIDDGLLFWRYFPSTGRPGSADVEYPVFMSYAEESQKQSVQVVRRFTAEKGEIVWDALDWKALPTLHHIIARLELLPMSTVVNCGLVERVGSGDLSSARRAGGPWPKSSL